uniref:SNARE-associated protein Snapin-like n=1 Tax=Styela clava TaxID=7725 RepID=UPI001939D584|nr:SNARE-associated protein Snapin-like [Styela clava]
MAASANVLSSSGQDISNGIFQLLKPAVEQVDTQVQKVRESQLELRQQIEAVTNELQKISEEHQVNIDLEPYVQRLISTKRRVVLISNIVQNVQERLIKLHKNAEKEVIRHKAHSETQKALLDLNIQSQSTSTQSNQPSTSAESK